MEQMEGAKSHTEQGQICGNCAKTVPQRCLGEMRIPIMFRFVVRVVPRQRLCRLGCGPAKKRSDGLYVRLSGQ
jgi:hypothetical protein